MSRARWHRLASEVGFVVAPAGLDFLVPSTTSWVYERDAALEGMGLRTYRFRATGQRVGSEPEAMRGSAMLLRTAHAAWDAGLRRAAWARPQAWRPSAHAARTIASLAEHVPDVPLRALLTRACQALAAMGFASGYDRSLYLSDILKNGLTILLVEPRKKRTTRS